jgi:phosphoribosyl 1,2-cyclic phosphodiesterase
MKIKFYGVRGSYPRPGKNTLKYGGNTSCVSFSKEKDGKIGRIIVDCGTGIIDLGQEIVSNYFKGKEDLNISMLFTHLHPDHTQGFSFFAPNYFKECNLKLMGMKTLKQHVGTILEQSMLPPTFPIEYKDLKSKRKHYELKDGLSFEIHGMKVNIMQAYAPSHPQQGAMYFKITDLENNKSACCIWDLESKIGGDKAVVKFATDSDVMIHDTQYTNEEYTSTQLIVQGFGHSTFDMAIENAIQAKIKSKLVCTHYNPSHNDDMLDKIQEQIWDKGEGFQVVLAKEGMEIDL